MKVALNKVVSMEYQITDENGEVLDASEQGDEWQFLVGAGEVPEGLEKALDGRQTGDSVSVVVSPEEGYGVRQEELVQTLSKADLGDEVELDIGDQLEAETDDGWEIVTVVAMDDDTVTVDGNHALAGKTLKFDVKIVEVRDATPEELEHGHVHQGGCEEEFDWDDADEDFDDDDEDEDEASKN